MDSKVDRRDVLASIGTVGAVTLSNGVRATKTGAKTHLVEASIEFKLPDNTYVETRIDGNPVYVVDEDKSAIVLYPTGSPQRDRLISKDTVIAGWKINGKRATIGPSGENKIVIRTLGYRRPAKAVVVDESVNSPNSVVKITGKKAKVDVEGKTVEVNIGESKQVELDPLQLSPFVQNRKNKKETIESISEYRLAHPVETSKKAVTAEPILNIKNWGELPVVEVTDR